MLRYSPIGDRELSQILQAVKSYLALERESGVEEYFLKVVIKKESLGSKLSSDLESLKREVKNCTGCDLHATRRNVVFGSGNPKAKLLFIGEAPGEEEDIQAMPFVGRAGQLLTKIIEAMGLKRQE